MLDDAGVSTFDTPGCSPCHLVVAAGFQGVGTEWQNAAIAACPVGLGWANALGHLPKRRKRLGARRHEVDDCTVGAEWKNAAIAVCPVGLAWSNALGRLSVHRKSGAALGIRVCATDAIRAELRSG